MKNLNHDDIAHNAYMLLHNVANIHFMLYMHNDESCKYINKKDSLELACAFFDEAMQFAQYFKNLESPIKKENISLYLLIHNALVRYSDCRETLSKLKAEYEKNNA